jgi:hypothetical protein
VRCFLARAACSVEDSPEYHVAPKGTRQSVTEIQAAHGNGNLLTQAARSPHPWPARLLPSNSARVLNYSVMALDRRGRLYSWGQTSHFHHHSLFCLTIMTRNKEIKRIMFIKHRIDVESYYDDTKPLTREKDCNVGSSVQRRYSFLYYQKPSETISERLTSLRLAASTASSRHEPFEQTQIKC